MNIISFLVELEQELIKIVLESPVLLALITLLSVFDIIFGFVEFLNQCGQIQLFVMAVILTAAVIGLCVFTELIFVVLIILMLVFLTIFFHARERGQRRSEQLNASMGAQCTTAHTNLELTASREYRWASSCLAGNRPREAIDYLRKCRGSITGRPKFFISYADAFILLNNFSGALKKLDAISAKRLKQRSLFEQVTVKKAYCYHVLCEYAKELECYDELLARGIQPEIFYFRRGQVKLRMLEICSDLKLAEQAICAISNSRENYIAGIFEDFDKAQSENKHRGDQYEGKIFSHKGAACLYARSYQESWELLTTAQQKNEFYPNTYIYLGIYYYYNGGSADQVIDTLKTALVYSQDANTVSDVALFYLAKAYYDVGDYDQALYYAAQSLAVFPYRSECFRIQGGCYKNGKSMYAEAIGYYTKAIKLNPEAGDYEARAYCAYLGKEDCGQAYSDIQEAIKLNNCDNYQVLALVYRSCVDKRKGFIREKNELDNLLAPYIDNSRFFVNLGVIYHNYQYFEDAQRCYRKGIEEDPQDKSAHYNLALVLEYMELYQEAIVEFNIAIKLEPMDIKSYRALVGCYQCVGDVINEVKAQKRLEEVERCCCEIQKKNGDAVYKIEKYLEAISYYKTALTYCSTPAVLNNLACAYYTQERYQEAVDCLEKAIKLDQTYFLAYLNLGNSQLRISESESVPAFQEKAKRNFQVALTLNKECEQAALMLEFLCAENIEMVIDRSECETVM